MSTPEYWERGYDKDYLKSLIVLTPRNDGNYFKIG